VTDDQRAIVFLSRAAVDLRNQKKALTFYFWLIKMGIVSGFSLNLNPNKEYETGRC
jgi:hypothetical protein